MHVQTKDEIEKQKNKLKTILDLFNKLCLHSPWFIYLFPSKPRDVIFLLWSSEKLWNKVDKSRGSPCFRRASESPAEPVEIQLVGPHQEFLVLLRGGPRICISKMFLYRDADAAGVGTTLWEALPRWGDSYLWIILAKIQVE